MNKAATAGEYLYAKRIKPEHDLKTEVSALVDFHLNLDAELKIMANRLIEFRLFAKEQDFEVLAAVLESAACEAMHLSQVIEHNRVDDLQSG